MYLSNLPNTQNNPKNSTRSTFQEQKATQNKPNATNNTQSNDTNSRKGLNKTKNTLPNSCFLLLICLHITAHCLVSGIDASIICNRIKGLVPQQRRICRAYPEAMATVGEGTEMAIEECKKQFALRRWNCTSSKKESPLFFMTRIASKESAFVSAIRSASIAYSITKACSLGNLSSCACDRSPNYQKKSRRNVWGSMLRRKHRNTKEDWQWGGCSANVNYGVNFCRKFLDAREKYLDNSKALMNLHNNEAGRKILKDNMKTNCRCSGVSGSCAVKMCWYSLPNIKVIGDRLMRSYNRARQVVPMRGQRSLSAVFLKLKRSASHTQKKPNGKDLIYLSESPSYCRRNKHLGVLGTRGRKCERKGKHKESCRHVCCRRGFKTRMVTRKTKCHCTFHWCCYVTCKECMEVVEESRCR